MHRRPRLLRHAALILAAVPLALSVSSCSGSSTSGSSTTTASGTPGSGTTPGSTPGTTAGPGSPGFNEPTNPFYAAPDPLPAAAPGTIIRQEPFPGAPAGAQAWRVLYHSKGLQDQDIAVSGVIIAPTGPAPAGGRPILSWAHPTTGVVDSCAPSNVPLFWDLIPGLAGMLSAGYVVAATDYEGLGTTGVHPYLVGESEGRGVLDAARAARLLPDAGAGTNLLLWGHSQGGQASLFAGQLAPAYAPELHLVATAAAAPAGELAALLALEEEDPTGVVLGSYAVNAYQDVYGPTTPDLQVDQVVTPAGAAVIPQVVALCDLTQSAQIQPIVAPVVGTFYVDGGSSKPPWKPLLDENSPGRVKSTVPVLITQGTADTVVIPSTTVTLVQGMCGLGDQVELKVYDGVPHATIGYASANDVLAWMKDRLQGTPAPVTCGADIPSVSGTTGGSTPGSTP